MKKILMIALIIGLVSLNAKDSMKIDGLFRAYNIGTYKQSGEIQVFNRNSLAVGGHLGITSAKYSNWFTRASLMTTQGVGIDSSPNQIEDSILSRNDATIDGNRDSGDNGDGITILGEAFLAFDNGDIDIKVGRQIYDSPFAAAKDVRMIPTTFSGANSHYNVSGHKIGIAYFDKIKQRTTSRFYNILEHALGTQTQIVTGRKGAGLSVASIEVNEKFRLYNYNINDFMNTTYVDYKGGDSIKWAVQAMYQTSVGNFDTSLKEGNVLIQNQNTIYTEGLKASGAGAKISFGPKGRSVTLATTYTGSKTGAFSHIIAPFDGTPLFTDTITGNNLFKSIYGQALNADSAYTADTLSFKASYKHAHTKNVSSYLAVARYDQALGGVAQTDINAVVSWKIHGWDLAAKAIYVFDDAQVAGDKFQQYRLIANYKFHK